MIKSRNKVAGYYDTEFANRINYCRYIGEIVVLQNKGKFILENVLKYLLRCNHTQQQIISHYLEKDYKDDTNLFELPSPDGEENLITIGNKMSIPESLNLLKRIKKRKSQF